MDYSEDPLRRRNSLIRKSQLEEVKDDGAPKRQREYIQSTRAQAQKETTPHATQDQCNRNRKQPRQPASMKMQIRKHQVTIKTCRTTCIINIKSRPRIATRKYTTISSRHTELRLGTIPNIHRKPDKMDITCTTHHLLHTGENLLPTTLASIPTGGIQTLPKHLWSRYYHTTPLKTPDSQLQKWGKRLAAQVYGEIPHILPIPPTAQD